MTSLKKETPFTTILARRGINDAEAYSLTRTKNLITTDGPLSHKLSGSVQLARGRITSKKDIDERLNKLKHF